MAGWEAKVEEAGRGGQHRGAGCRDGVVMENILNKSGAALTPSSNLSRSLPFAS